MAGNYADPLGHRFPYDRDGTVVVRTGGTTYQGPVVDITHRAVDGNNESTQGSLTNFSNAGNHGIIWIFPELRDITGVFTSGGGASFEWSPDTKSGVDGTWHSLPNIARGSASPQSARIDIRPLEIEGAKGVRFSFSGGNGANHYLYMVHWYGHIHDPASLDRLEIWKPYEMGPVTPGHFEWGDRPRDSFDSRSFRVSNRSSNRTARSITVSTEALTPGSPPVADFHEFYMGGVSGGTSINIGDLLPGETSPVITVEQTIPSNAQLSLWWPRIVAEADTWEVQAT